MKTTHAILLSAAALLPGAVANAQSSDYVYSGSMLELNWTPTLPAQIPVGSPRELRFVKWARTQGLLCTREGGVSLQSNGDPTAQSLQDGLDFRGMLLARARGRSAKELAQLVARVDAAPTRVAKVGELYGITWDPTRVRAAPGEAPMETVSYSQRDELELGRPVTIAFSGGGFDACLLPQEVDQAVNEGLRALRGVIAALGAGSGSLQSAPKGPSSGSGTLKTQ